MELARRKLLKMRKKTLPAFPGNRRRSECPPATAGDVPVADVRKEESCIEFSHSDGGADDDQAEVVDALDFTAAELEVLHSTWKVSLVGRNHKAFVPKMYGNCLQIIYARIGEELCFIGSPPPVSAAAAPAAGEEEDGPDRFEGVSDTFYRLFESYPSSKGFFAQFRDLPLDELRCRFNDRGY